MSASIPIVSFPLQLHNALTGRCRKQKIAPAMLGRCLVEEGIPIIGVHLFFPETYVWEKKDAKTNRITGMSHYARYRDNVLEMLQTFPADGWARTVFFVESLDAQPATADILKGNGINASGIGYFFWQTGKIDSTSFSNAMWAASDGIEDVYYEMCKAPNANGMLLDKLKEMAGNGRIFVFGLYANLCMKNAISNLNELARDIGKTVEIMLDPMVTLGKSKRNDKISPVGFGHLRKLLQQIEEKS